MVDYSETIEVYGIKVGSTLNEYMVIYMYQRSRYGHSLTFVQGYSDFINFKQLLDRLQSNYILNLHESRRPIFIEA